jgi:hypothetical protein
MSQDTNPPQKVWVACRAAPMGRCEGKWATILRSVKTPGGGAIIHYKCQTCGRRFGVQV